MWGGITSILGGEMAKLTGKENAACECFVLHKGDKVKAYTEAGYSTRMSKAAIAVQADKLFNKPKITLKIEELQKIALTVYVKTKEDKLKILDDIIDACKAPDAEKGVINATAAIQAIKEHNIMQGDNAPTEISANVTTRTTLDDFYN